MKRLKADEHEEQPFGLHWPGKQQARELALVPTGAVLQPRPEQSVEWDATRNLLFEGDNLEVLKLLQKSYGRQVKLIYIDPPYNTGKEFVYPDHFGARASSAASGGHHAAWLNMIYPRLILARNLLRDDGVLLVSIDDHEAGHLRLVLDEVFGPQSFVSSIAWRKRSSPDARDTIGSVHDWIFVYVKAAAALKAAIGKLPLSDQRAGAYANPDGDPRGPWASVDMTGMTGRATKDQFFGVTLPSGRKVKPPPGRSWGLAPATFEALRADGRIWFGRDGDGGPRIKRFLRESGGQVVPSLWDAAEAGSNDEAKKEINELMGQSGVFDTPKPVRLIDRMIQFAAKDPDAIVMDFFAGSGTTGHAVMARGARGDGRRRFILVQRPQPLERSAKKQAAAAGFCARLRRPLCLTELTKERLRRAGDALRPGAAKTADLGFRVFRLAAPGETKQAAAATPEDFLPGVLLELGLDLCAPVETRRIARKQVQAIGGGVLFACLQERIEAAVVEALAEGIARWRDELAPRAAVTCAFAAGALADEGVSALLAAALQQRGLGVPRLL